MIPNLRSRPGTSPRSTPCAPVEDGCVRARAFPARRVNCGARRAHRLPRPHAPRRAAREREETVQSRAQSRGYEPREYIRVRNERRRIKCLPAKGQAAYTQSLRNEPLSTPSYARESAPLIRNTNGEPLRTAARVPTRRAHISPHCRARAPGLRAPRAAARPSSRGPHRATRMRDAASPRAWVSPRGKCG